MGARNVSVNFELFAHPIKYTLHKTIFRTILLHFTVGKFENVRGFYNFNFCFNFAMDKQL